MGRSKTQTKRRGRSNSDKRSPKGLRPVSNAARDRALKALWAMRHGDPLSRAAHDNGVTIRTIKRYVGSELLQDRPGGRIRATKSDRLVRYMQIPGPDGPKDVTVRGSKAASELGRYMAAVGKFLRSGEVDALAKFQGKSIGGHVLITDPDTLSVLAQAGAPTLDEIYA